jgi:hypothetical protein
MAAEASEEEAEVSAMIEMPEGLAMTEMSEDTMEALAKEDSRIVAAEEEEEEAVEEALAHLGEGTSAKGLVAIADSERITIQNTQVSKPHRRSFLKSNSQKRHST